VAGQPRSGRHTDKVTTTAVFSARSSFKQIRVTGMDESGGRWLRVEVGGLEIGVVYLKKCKMQWNAAEAALGRAETRQGRDFLLIGDSITLGRGPRLADWRTGGLADWRTAHRLIRSQATTGETVRETGGGVRATHSVPAASEHMRNMEKGW